jgi:hypothetical protein
LKKEIKARKIGMMGDEPYKIGLAYKVKIILFINTYFDFISLNAKFLSDSKFIMWRIQKINCKSFGEF